tara:strand:- start:3625 stop:3834 length:210 start_codon:yes stop_codon:yes gene_type:complete
MSKWEEILIEKGFTYNNEEELYKKSLGFGRKITVSHIVKGLFNIKRGDEDVFDDFVSSLEEFKNIINKL